MTTTTKMCRELERAQRSAAHRGAAPLEGEVVHDRKT